MKTISLIIGVLAALAVAAREAHQRSLKFVLHPKKTFSTLSAKC
jgi:hypothetical protein